MGYRQEYRSLIEKHAGLRRGDARQRVAGGLGYGERTFLERVWWPIFGNFQGLHPEYEVLDHENRRYYIDFAFLVPGVRWAIEIDGLGPHSTDEVAFARDRRRQNFLVLAGWTVIRFSVNDVKNYPQLCALTLRQFLAEAIGRKRVEVRPGLKVGGLPDGIALSAQEREVLRLARSAAISISAADVVLHLNVCRNTAYRRLRRLREIGLLEPVKPGHRVHAYRLSDEGLRLVL